MRLGIIGLPLSGKTTVFNALTRGDYPTASAATGKLETHTAIVDVPDARVDRLSAMFKPRKTIYAKVTYIDFAGLEQGIGKTGLTGQLRNQIATTDAFVLVLRGFESSVSPHPLGSVNPQRDLELLHSEFLLADLVTAENRIARIDEMLHKGARSEERARLQDERALFERLQAGLEAGLPLRDLELTLPEIDGLAGFGLLSLKPTLVLLNAGEGAGAPDTVLKYEHRQTAMMALQGKLEMELAQLPPDEASMFMEEFGIQELGLDRVIHTSYEMLELCSFFTVGEDEVRAWTLRRGATALDAAGAVHTDLARGFIRAEVIGYTELATLGGMVAARKVGKVQLEGKEYLVRDGDIVHIRFSL